MKKRCMLVSLVLIIIFSLSVFAEEIRTESVMIDFTTTQVYPEPVEPGKDVTLKVNIKNDDSLDATGVKVVPRVVYPFQMKSQEDDWWRGFNLCARCTRENTYYFLIDSKAESGTYPLIFDIIKGPTKQTKTVNVKVEGVPDVILLTESNEPILVEPKIQFAVNFVVRNIGTGEARNLKIISDSEEFISSGSNTQFVEGLKPGKTMNITAFFTASDELEPDVYNVPVRIEYKDSVGNSYSYDGNIGIIVRNKAEISVKNIKIRPDILRKDDKYELSMRVENTGSGSAKNTVVHMTTSAGDSITQYIGQLKKDEDSSVVSSLVAKNEDLHSSVINRVSVEVSYEDDVGRHVVKEDILIEVLPNQKMLWYFLYGIIAFLLVLFTAAYYLYEHKKEQLENRFEEVIEYGLAEEFVNKYGGDWSKDQFKEFVEELKRKNFVVDPKRLRRYLEKVRVERSKKTGR